MTYSKIVIPLDGSDLAEKALEAAIPLAKAYAAPVVLVGVLDLTAGMYDVYSEAFSPVDLKAQLESFLETALSRAKARLEQEGLSVSSRVKVGVPHEEITALAEAENADLIIMTTHGRRGLTHLLLGSVTERVIRTAHCPVLVVRPDAAAPQAS